MLKVNKSLILFKVLMFMVLCGAKAQTSQLDVDRLYAKYKGQTETVIFAGDREINAHVLINYNSHNKPYRIIIYGETAADAAMESLINDLCEAKEKAGYKRLPRTTVVNFDQKGAYENNIEVRAYEKGSQYARYGIKPAEKRNQALQENATERYSSDFFYFEVGDMTRKKNRKPEKFDF